MTAVETDTGAIEARARRYDTLTQRMADARAKADQQPQAAFTAAAQRIDGTNAERERARIKRVSAQGTRTADAWTFYDLLSEIKEGARYKERALSKLGLYPAVRIKSDTDPVPLDTINPDTDQPYVTAQAAIDASRAAYDRLDAGVGTGHITGRWGTIGFVAGDSYLVSYPDSSSATGETNALVTADNLKTTDKGGWALALASDSKQEEWIPLDPGTSMLTRIWNQHAHWPNEADSAVLGVLDICERLLLYGNLEFGTAASHMNAGLMLFASGTFARNRQHPDDDTGQTAGNQLRNPTIQDVVEQVLTPISDPRSVAVAAPAMMEADIDKIQAARHITFDRPFDAEVDSRIERLIVRLSNGVTLPKEILLGISDSNNWNAFMIDDMSWRNYLEPDAREQVSAISAGYHRPVILADWAVRGLDARTPIGVGPEGQPLTVQNLCLWMDTSNLIGDPDEVENVFKGYDSGLLGSTPARTRIGWSEAEAPTPEDIALLVQLHGKASPQGTPAPPGGNGGVVGGQPNEPGTMPDQAEPGDAVAAAGTPRPGANPAKFARLGPAWAARDAALLTRTLAQCDTAMGRALDRAGAKLRTKAVKASAAHRDVVAHAANRDVGSLLGPGVVAAALELSPGELLDGQFDEVVTRFRSGVGRAQATTRAELERLGLDPATAADLAATQEDHRDKAATLLGVLLVGLATERIFNPHPAAPAAGELDTELSVSTGLVRQALSTAGGAQGRTTAGGAVLAGPAEVPQAGVALGPDITSLLADVGGAIAEYTWDYGDESSRTRPFEGHEALADQTFTSWDDDVLLNDSGWIVATHYFPGDHDGCQCQAVPTIVGGPQPDQAPDEP